MRNSLHPTRHSSRKHRSRHPILNYDCISCSIQAPQQKEVSRKSSRAPLLCVHGLKPNLAVKHVKTANEKQVLASDCSDSLIYSQEEFAIRFTGYWFDSNAG